jgi:hypothetical protein
MRSLKQMQKAKQAAPTPGAAPGKSPFMAFSCPHVDHCIAAAGDASAAAPAAAGAAAAADPATGAAAPAQGQVGLTKQNSKELQV